MEDILEISPTGRAACHTCRAAIPKGAVRFGHAVPNPFSTSGSPKLEWHHLACAAKVQPAKTRAAMARFTSEIPDRDAIEEILAATPERATATPYSPSRLPTADRAPTDRAHCWQCNSPIAKGTVRVGVEREVETEAFTGKTTGWLHHGCAEAWAEVNWIPGVADFWSGVRRNSALAATDFAAPNSPPAPKADPKDATRVRKIAKHLAEGKRDAAEKDLRQVAQERPAWIWERVAAGELAADDQVILDALGASFAAVEPEGFQRALPRLVGGPGFLPGLSARVFGLLAHAFRVQPQKLRELAARMPEGGKVGVALLDAREGTPVPEELREATLALLAAAAADPACGETDVAALAGELGVDEEALARQAREAVLAADRPAALACFPVLVRLGLPELCTRLARLDLGGVSGRLLVERRSALGLDTAEASLAILDAATAGLADDDGAALRVVEELALAVARRFEVAPAAVDRFALGELPFEDWRPVLRALPRERLQALRTRVAAGGAEAQALALDALLGGEDAQAAVQSVARLAEQTRAGTLREASLVGLGGSSVLPALVAEHAARRAALPEDPRKAQPQCRALAALQHAIVVAVGAAAADGAPTDAAMDDYLRPDPKVFVHEDCGSLFFTSDRRAFQATLAALPEDRLRAFAQAWRDSGLSARAVETWLRWVMPES